MPRPRARLNLGTGSLRNAGEYVRRTPRVRWTEAEGATPQPVTDYYRVVNREVVSGTLERTFVTALLPKQVATIHTIVGTVFRRPLDCTGFFALSASVVLDFFVKSTGTGHVNTWLLTRLPILAEDCAPGIHLPLRARALALSCLTTHYRDLWEDVCATTLPEDPRRPCGAERRDEAGGDPPRGSQVDTVGRQSAERSRVCLCLGNSKSLLQVGPQFLGGRQKQQVCVRPFGTQNGALVPLDHAQNPFKQRFQLGNVIGVVHSVVNRPLSVLATPPPTSIENPLTRARPIRSSASRALRHRIPAGTRTPAGSPDR